MGASSLALPLPFGLTYASAAVLSRSAWHLLLDTRTDRWAVAGQVVAGAPDIGVTKQHFSSPWTLSTCKLTESCGIQYMRVQQVLTRSTLCCYAGFWAGTLSCAKRRMGAQAARSLLCRHTRIPAHQHISPCSHLPQRQPLRLPWHQVTQQANILQKKDFPLLSVSSEPPECVTHFGLPLLNHMGAM